MTGDIFINYRRSDSQAIVGRIDDYLRDAFGIKHVFRDMESIPAGQDFGSYIQNQLIKCRVFLVVIGNSWLSDRLYDKSDWVLLEIEQAIRLKLVIIPIYVEGAKMLINSQLPDTIKILSKLNAISIDSGPRFRDQVYHLIAEIRKYFQEKTTQAKSIEEKLRVEAMEKFDRLVKTIDESEKMRMLELATRANLITLQKAIPEIEQSVSKIKVSLKTLGFYNGSINEEYTANFFESVTAFQRSVGLTPADGIFGRDTFVELLRRLHPEQFKRD